MNLSTAPKTKGSIHSRTVKQPLNYPSILDVCQCVLRRLLWQPVDKAFVLLGDLVVCGTVASPRLRGFLSRRVTICWHSGTCIGR